MLIREVLGRDRPLIEEGLSKGSWVTDRPLTEQGPSKRQLRDGPANENTEEEEEAAERKKLQKEEKAMITPAWYEVVHSHVVARAAADVTSGARAVLKRGTKVCGTLHAVSGSPWLLLSREFCISELQLPQEIADVWVLIHGFRVGLGALLVKCKHNDSDEEKQAVEVRGKPSGSSEAKEDATEEVFGEKAAKLAVEKAAVVKEPAEEELASAATVAETLASPKAQQSKREFQQKAAAERAAAEEREKEAANEEAFTEIDVEGHMAKEKAATLAAQKAAAEKKLAEEQAAKLPAEKVAVAKEPAKHKLAFAEKVAEMSASPKAHRSKRELQVKPALTSASERAAAEEKASEASNEKAFTEIDVEGHYRVIHDKVALRESPSTNARLCGLGKKDMEFIGTPCQVGETTWLRLNKEKSTELGDFLIYGDTQAWILIDGTILGHSLLLQRMKEAEQVTRTAIDKQAAECKEKAKCLRTGKSIATDCEKERQQQEMLEQLHSLEQLLLTAAQAMQTPMPKSVAVNENTGEGAKAAELKKSWEAAAPATAVGTRARAEGNGKFVGACHALEQRNGESSKGKAKHLATGKGIATDCEKERQQQEMLERADELSIDVLSTAVQAKKTPMPKSVAVKENAEEEAKAAEVKNSQNERKQQNVCSDDNYFVCLGELLKPVEQIEPDAKEATKFAEASNTSTPKASAVNENRGQEAKAAEVKKVGEAAAPAMAAGDIAEGKCGNSWFEAEVLTSGEGTVNDSAQVRARLTELEQLFQEKAVAVNENTEEESRAVEVKKAAEVKKYGNSWWEACAEVRSLQRQREQHDVRLGGLYFDGLGELLHSDLEPDAKSVTIAASKPAAVNAKAEEEAKAAEVNRAAEERKQQNVGSRSQNFKKRATFSQFCAKKADEQSVISATHEQKTEEWKMQIEDARSERQFPQAGKLSAETETAEKAAAERAKAEKAAAEKAAAEEAAAEKAAAEKAAAEKAAAEKAAAEKAAAEKATAEKAVAEKAVAAKAAVEQLAAKKETARKAAAEKRAAKKSVVEDAASEKAAAAKAAAEKAAAEKAHAVGLQEKLAEELYQQAVAAVSELKDADALLENMQKVLDAIAATHSQAPDSKTITDKLLKLCVVMARSLLQLAPVCLEKDPKNAIVMQDASHKLDDLAGKLVFVMGDVGDPAAKPQLDEKPAVKVRGKPSCSGEPKEDISGSAAAGQAFTVGAEVTDGKVKVKCKFDGSEQEKATETFSHRRALIRKERTPGKVNWCHQSMTG